MELTEEQKNCPYCHDDTGWNPVFEKPWMNIFYDVDHFILTEASGRYRVHFKFCPMCGRDLRSEGK